MSALPASHLEPNIWSLMDKCMRPNINTTSFISRNKS